MKTLRIFFPILVLLLSISASFAQVKNLSDTKTTPIVFFIGEEEAVYEKLIKNYNNMLFSVCDNSMEQTSESWSLFLKDMENFATNSNFDLKGTKLWLNVFWNKDGIIDHIAFFPKPNSKNLNYDEVKIILNNFAKSYQLPLKYKSKFSHYGSASFPVFTKAMLAQEK